MHSQYKGDIKRDDGPRKTINAVFFSRLEYRLGRYREAPIKNSDDSISDHHTCESASACSAGTGGPKLPVMVYGEAFQSEATSCMDGDVFITQDTRKTGFRGSMFGSGSLNWSGAESEGDVKVCGPIKLKLKKNAGYRRYRAAYPDGYQMIRSCGADRFRQAAAVYVDCPYMTRWIIRSWTAKKIRIDCAPLPLYRKKENGRILQLFGERSIDF
jgi:hypothetical protein